MPPAGSTNSPSPRCWARVTGRISPALAIRRWSSKAICMRSGPLRGSIRWALLVSGRFRLSETIIPEAVSSFSSLHRAATLILSVDWGLGGSDGIRTAAMDILTRHGKIGRCSASGQAWDCRQPTARSAAGQIYATNISLTTGAACRPRVCTAVDPRPSAGPMSTMITRSSW